MSACHAVRGRLAAQSLLNFPCAPDMRREDVGAYLRNMGLVRIPLLPSLVKDHQEAAFASDDNPVTTLFSALLDLVRLQRIACSVFKNTLTFQRSSVQYLASCYVC